VHVGALDTEYWYDMFDEVSRTFYPFEIDEQNFYNPRLVALRHNISEECIKVRRDMRAIVCRYLASLMRCLSQRYSSNVTHLAMSSPLLQPLGKPMLLHVPHELRYGSGALHAMRLRMLPADPNKSLKYDTLHVGSTNDTLLDVFSICRTPSREHAFYGFGNEYELSIGNDDTFVILPYDLRDEAAFYRTYFKYFDNIGGCEFVLRYDYRRNTKDQIFTRNINMKYLYDACLLRLDDSLIPISRDEQPLPSHRLLSQGEVSVLTKASKAAAKIAEAGVGTHVTRIKAKRASERVLRSKDFSQVTMQLYHTTCDNIAVSVNETMLGHERDSMINIDGQTYRVFGERDGTCAEMCDFMERSHTTKEHYIILPLFFYDSMGYVYRVTVRAIVAVLGQPKSGGDLDNDPIDQYRCTLNIECENPNVPVVHFHYHATLLYAYFAYQLIVNNMLCDKRIDTRCSTFTSFAELHYTNIERAREIYEHLRVMSPRPNPSTTAATNTESAGSANQLDPSTFRAADDDNNTVSTTGAASVVFVEHDEVPVIGSELLIDTHFIKLALLRICNVNCKPQQCRTSSNKRIRLNIGNGGACKSDKSTLSSNSNYRTPECGESTLSSNANDGVGESTPSNNGNNGACESTSNSNGTDEAGQSEESTSSSNGNDEARQSDKSTTSSNGNDEAHQSDESTSSSNSNDNAYQSKKSTSSSDVSHIHPSSLENRQEEECVGLVNNDDFSTDCKNSDVLDLESRFLLNVFALHCIKYRL